MRSPYFFFRPFVSPQHGWVAFDFTAGAGGSPNVQDYLRCIKEANASSLGGMHPLIIPAKPAWIEQEGLVDSLEPRQAIYVMPPQVLESTATLERCKKLLGHGYHLGIQVTGTDIVRQIPLTSFDHVSLSAAFAHDEMLASDLKYIDDAGFRKIATGVNSHEAYGWLTAKGFELCQSAFLSTRNTASGRQPDLARLKLLKLLSIVERDGDTREIEAIFREEAKLSYNLLRLVNSVAVGARIKINNFSQAIAILGRHQLQRWLQLLIYANNLTDGNIPNPLMQLAAARGRQMELLSAAITPAPDIPELSDNAFMVGLFSLLGVLINLPMTEILKEIPLQDVVTDALGNPADDGVLGQLLTAISAGEAGKFDASAQILSNLGINQGIHIKSQVSAYHWASRINLDHHN